MKHQTRNKLFETSAERIAFSGGDDVIDRLTLEWVLSHLTDEEQDILWLHEIEELTLEEVGRVVGEKYRGKALTGSAVRYHKDKILQRLRQLRAEVGLE